MRQVIAAILAVLVSTDIGLADGSDTLEPETFGDGAAKYVARSIDVEHGPIGIRQYDGSRLPPLYSASSGTVQSGVVDLNEGPKVNPIPIVELPMKRRYHPGRPRFGSAGRRQNRP